VGVCGFRGGSGAKCFVIPAIKALLDLIRAQCRLSKDPEAMAAYMLKR